MLDLSCVKKRYFTVKFDNRRLDIEPPKLKTINKIVDIIKGAQHGSAVDAAAELTPMLVLLLSKNKQNFKVSAEVVAQQMDYDTMRVFLKSLFSWLNTEKKDPN